jgi:hypothetical protein
LDRHAPQLLLNSQTLRRLKRDRERQTVRWANFERRVQTVSDSPQRGFELALYYALTGDQAKGKEAVQWAKAHKCERRQLALVLDWCSDLISAEDAKAIGEACPTQQGAEGVDLRAARDAIFLKVALGRDIGDADLGGWKDLDAQLQQGKFRNGEDVIAAVEYVSAVRTATHEDLRERDRRFFSGLPAQFLLAMKPSELEQPGWARHVAALALVNLDPNLEGSQYLQGWAAGGRQQLQDGPGVAYELLWGDPYLPGIAYQNMQPWFYDDNGHLFARTDWDPKSCWISVAPDKVESVQCAHNDLRQPATYGNMRLVPAMTACTEAPARKGNETVILWKLPPGQALVWGRKQLRAGIADAAGMWRIPENVSGKICPAGDSHPALP